MSAQQLFFCVMQLISFRRGHLVTKEIGYQAELETVLYDIYRISYRY